MKSYAEHARSAVEHPPFRSGADWSAWHFRVCLGGGVGSRRCVHENMLSHDGEGCPLIQLSIEEKTPAEWTGPTGAVILRCTEKATAAEQAAADAAAEKARVEAEHYPLFEVE